MIKRRAFYRLSGLIVAFCIPALTLIANAQQLDCSDSVKAALQTTGTKCDQMTRNKACYGSSLVMATANDSVPADQFVFQKPGDIVDIANLHTLRLAPLDQKTKQWGIAYLRIQANLPDTTAGQYVTMLMFGDTAIENQSQQVSTATQPVNPMQAVYFRTGIGSPACHNAPTSGLIIQAPKGAQPVKMTIDGVQLGISSTALIQAPADDLDSTQPINAPLGTDVTASPTRTPSNTPPPTNTPRFSKTTPTPRHLKISTIEGHVTVTSNGHTVTVGGGQQTSVDLDDQSIAPLGNANPIPAQPDTGLQSFVSLLIQPGVGNVLLTPTETFTPRPTQVAYVPLIPTNTYPPPASNTPTTRPPNTSVPPPPVVASNTPTSTPTSTSTSTLTNTPACSQTTVTSLADSGPCTLRTAIATAPAGSTISFGVTGTITLTSGVIAITQNLSINGPSARLLTISANNTSRIFVIAATGVSLSGLTFTAGQMQTGFGGAIDAPNGVTISGCAFVNNSAKYGGAINLGGLTTISGSTFTGNNAFQGGAIYQGGGQSTITNSTFYNNSALAQGDTSMLFGTMSLIEDTVFGNTANAQGGGFYNSGTLNLTQTIVAGNPGGPPDISGNPVTSLGYNLIGDATGTSGFVSTDITGTGANPVPANLLAFGNNGGSTNTLLPDPLDSLAHNVPQLLVCALPFDQRGVSRPQGAACDIGAAETP